MNKFNQKKLDLILSAYIDFQDKNIQILDGISGRAFNGFKKTLSKRGISLDEEEKILFTDFTTFGSGADGLLITNEQLYYKFFSDFKHIELTDIHRMKMDGERHENILIVLKNGQSISLSTDTNLDDIKTVIDILTGANGMKVNIEGKQVKCLGCRAIINTNQNFCEYCRSPLS